MNPVFVFLVLVGAVVLWFLLSALFYPFGRFLHRIWKDEVGFSDVEEKELEVITPKIVPVSKAKCPQCGGELVFEGGCNTCKNCGWSKCD